MKEPELPACSSTAVAVKEAASARHHRSDVSGSSTLQAHDTSTDLEYRPRPRRLSRYIQMRGDVAGLPGSTFIAAATGTPRWLQSLLNDDLHTGRNVGAKLAYMCENIVRPASVETIEAPSPNKLVDVDGVVHS